MHKFESPNKRFSDGNNGIVTPYALIAANVLNRFRILHIHAVVKTFVKFYYTQHRGHVYVFVQAQAYAFVLFWSWILHSAEPSSVRPLLSRRILLLELVLTELTRSRNSQNEPQNR